MAISLTKNKLCNVIIKKSFKKFNSDRFKDTRATYKYCQKELDKNTF